jgi:hypothetical protein
VRDFRESGRGFASDALGGRVGSEERRVGLLEGAELVHPAVIFGVGDFGRVEHIVQVLVVAKGGAELFGERGGILGSGRGRGSGFARGSRFGSRFRHESSVEKKREWREG